VNALQRCFCIVCTIVALVTTDVAWAQRVRFGSQDDDYIPVADNTPILNSKSAAPIYVVPQAVDTPISLSSDSAPPSSFGSSLATPQYVASSWDPYRVAQRSTASFTGTITSTPGQYLLPQPMPRVPYYTQQPVVGSGPPVVVVPGQQNPAPPIFPTTVQPGPIVPATVPPPVVIPPAGPATTVVPPPIAPAVIPPPATASACYVEADAIFFTRDTQIGNRPLILLDPTALGPTQSNVLLSTGDLNFNWQVGPRILIGHDFDAFHAIEASYFGIFNFKETATRTGTNDLNLPGDLGADAPFDFFNADQMTVNYTSVINNAEINYLTSYGDLSCLVGFRYFNLGEVFSIASTDLQTGTSFYRVNAYNNLFGLQGGARIQQGCGTCTSWSYDITAKAGVYGNDVSSSQNITDFDGFVQRAVKNHGANVAFVGDLEFNTNYQLNANWSIRGGYQVFWVQGVALAPDQLDFTDNAASGTHLDKSSGLFMQGAHAGLMAKF
jgi:hypothetical protein